MILNSCISRVTGSLISGAIGYPVKFTSLEDIERKYGDLRSSGVSCAKSAYRSCLFFRCHATDTDSQASTELLAHAEMYVTRAPAVTTLAALHSGTM